jgi:transcriptional regulator with XRE-family HTH domain
MIDIGRTLKEYFDAQGITQQSIATTMGVSKAYVNRLFTGKAQFGKEAAEKWSNQFGLHKSWLLTGEGPMLASGSSPSSSIVNGAHSSQAVGDGARAVNNEGLKDCLEIIRQQQETIKRQAETISKLLDKLG